MYIWSEILDMLQIKLFNSVRTESEKERVNKWLRETPGIVVHDIKASEGQYGVTLVVLYYPSSDSVFGGNQTKEKSS